MPVKFRIAFLFSLVVFIILAIVCTSIYYFSYQSRLEVIKTRLTNRSITTARLLGQSEIFDRHLVEWIDSLTTISLKDKSVQAYNSSNKKIYSYSDLPSDSISVSEEILEKARSKPGGYFFEQGAKEVIAYYYEHYNTVVVCAARDDDAKRSLYQLKAILWLSFVIGIFIALISGYFFSDRLLLPIKNITNDVTEISAQNLARRIQTGKIKDEWYHMSRTLNDLLDRLQESFELQKRFIANASHELSTPLTAISSQLEIALQRKRTSPEYEKIIATTLKDVKYMTKLTQTLLELAKTAENSGGLTITLVRIDEIIMEIPGMMQKQNSRYEVYLEFDTLPENEDDLLVFGNADLLTIAIANIVSNACKYSPDNRAVISFTIRDKNFVIAVSDKGAGIPDAEIENVFQPFYRIDNSRSLPGFGLGLSLAYRIIKLHKGEIRVESALNKGTTFTLYIPSSKRGII
jgi:signal transduction histidine kinase